MERGKEMSQVIGIDAVGNSAGSISQLTMGYEFNLFGNSTSIVGRKFRTFEDINDDLIEKEIPKPKSDSKTWWKNLVIGVGVTVGFAALGALAIITAPVSAPAALVLGVAGLAFGASAGAAYATASTAINDKISGVVTSTKDFMSHLIACADAGAQIGFSVGTMIGGGIDTYHGLKSLLSFFGGGLGGGMTLATEAIGYGIKGVVSSGINVTEALTAGGLFTEGLLAMAEGNNNFSGGVNKAKEEIEKQNSKDETERNNSERSSETPERVYKANDGKHKGSAKGDISADPFWNNQAAGQESLNTAYTSKNTKQLYNVYEGKLVKFQPDNAGTWHAYEIKNPSAEVPADVLRSMKNDGLITKNQYNKWIKNN